jgi:exodeoxyribonuclease VII large subunit
MTEKTLFDPPAQGSNIPEFSVMELSQLVKRQIEGAFGHVRVRGEVTAPKLHSSGHLYLTLKDDSAVLAAVCWRGSVSKLKVKIEEGMEIIATGRLTTFAGQSKYQLVIEQVALAGVGALLKMLDDRKQKLAAEGLFDAARKKPLPFLPRVIGVITSPTGAVIQDILHRLADRFPVKVLLWPVAVQGENAAAQVVAAINGFNAMSAPPDIIIVARGGGSLEDLLPFSEENVVRAAATSRIPLISAVGHETDTTLIDFAADKRAPTPTAAAEMAVPVRADLLARVAEESVRLIKAWQRYVDAQKMQVVQRAARLIHPRALIENLSQRLDERSSRMQIAAINFLKHQQQKILHLAAGLSLRPLKQQHAHQSQKLQQVHERLPRAFARVVETRHERLAGMAAMLESLSYQRTLQRGFAMVADEAGTTVTSAATIKPQQKLTLTFADGTRKVQAD